MSRAEGDTSPEREHPSDASAPGPADLADDTVRVLFVDDEALLVDSCMKIATHEGYFATCAGRGQLALEQVRKTRPEIVLVALELPDMDGMALLTEIRSVAPEALVIMITGFATVDSNVRAIEAGAYDYLPKPFTATQLRLLLGRAAHQVRLVRENAALRARGEERPTPGAEPNALTLLFDLPAPIRTACEQYLLYFVQFLRDLGIEAESELQHEASQVLFRVIPAEGAEALGQIREALGVYLSCPSDRSFMAMAAEENDVAVRQLEANVYHLRAQLAMANATLQMQSATIEALQLSNFRYRELLPGPVGPGETADSEAIIPGVLSVIEVEAKGVKVHLPEILRRLKRRFGA